MLLAVLPQGRKQFAQVIPCTLITPPSSAYIHADIAENMESKRCCQVSQESLLLLIWNLIVQEIETITIKLSSIIAWRKAIQVLQTVVCLVTNRMMSMRQQKLSWHFCEAPQTYLHCSILIVTFSLIPFMLKQYNQCVSMPIMHIIQSPLHNQICINAG